MILLRILIYSGLLFFTAKRMKLKNATYVTALKVSLLQGLTMYLLSYVAPYASVFSYILLIAFIKYFYKIDIKKTIILWLATTLLSVVIFFALAMFLGTIEIGVKSII